VDTTETGQVEVRQAARALVLDPAERLLLVRFVDPGNSEEWWATPGGGLDPGEDLEAGLRRELREETGLEGFGLGRVVWTRRHVFPWAGRTLDQHESFFLVRVQPFDLRPGIGLVALRAEAVHELRWWTLEELERSDARFAPSRLPSLLRALLTSGAGAEPIDVGI